MKNFYEATVTKQSLTVRMELTLSAIGTPWVYLEITDSLVLDQTLDHQMLIIEDLPVDDCINLYFELTRHHPEAVSVALSIDGFEVLPKYQQHLNLDGCYLDKTGKTLIHIPTFYPWYHEITGQGWIA